MLHTLATVLQMGPHGPGPMGPHAGSGPHAGGWLPWLGGPLFGVLLWVLVLVAVALVVWRLAGRERRREGLAVLEAEYARGNIDDEEFEARRRRLTGERSRSNGG